MTHLRGKLLYLLVGCLLVATLLGCVDGPFYRMWYRKQWEEDEKFGPTFYTRLEELQAARKQARSLSEPDQARLASQLTAALPNERSVAYRTEVVRTLGAFSCPAAAEGLRVAMQDADASVRVIACQAWGQRADQESLQALAETLGTDNDVDVRKAAARELAQFKDPAAVRALGVALDDSDPALQHRVVQSLRSVTGKDFGDSVPAWRQFVRGDQIHPDTQPTLAEKLRGLFR